MKSIYLQKDKTIFDLSEYPADAFATSLGLPGAPQIKFGAGQGQGQAKEKKRGGDAPAAVAQVEDSVAVAGRGVVASDDESDEAGATDDDDDEEGEVDAGSDHESDSDESPVIVSCHLPHCQSYKVITDRFSRKLQLFEQSTTGCLNVKTNRSSLHTTRHSYLTTLKATMTTMKYSP